MKPFITCVFILLILLSSGCTEELSLSQLTHSTSPEDSSFFPDWSPDGKKIIFEKGDRTVWIMDNDGTNKIKIMKDSDSIAGIPSFSPDGTRIAYAANSPYQIWIMNIDGTENLQLTEDIQSSNDFPVWSPDGNEIAYVKTINNSYEIWIMNSDGSNKRKLATLQNYLWLLQKSWSENNIIFSDRGDIWAVNVETQEIVQLTNNNEQYIIESNPTWSPNGKQISFVVEKRDINQSLSEKGIAMMNFDGTDRKYIFKDENKKWDFIESPVWSPDGKQLLFVVGSDNIYDIMVLYN